MHFANRELCEELYRLTGWTFSTTQYNYYYMSDPDNHSDVDIRRYFGPQNYFVEGFVFAPAYTASYLLEKLKLAGIYAMAGYSDKKNMVTAGPDTGVATAATDWGSIKVVQNNPQDALCKLAIELHKKGSL